MSEEANRYNGRGGMLSNNTMPEVSAFSISSSYWMVLPTSSTSLSTGFSP